MGFAGKGDLLDMVVNGLTVLWGLLGRVFCWIWWSTD